MAESAIRNFTINFGPRHPADHGVLRLVLKLDGEVVEQSRDLAIGSSIAGIPQGVGTTSIG